MVSIEFIQKVQKQLIVMDELNFHEISNFFGPELLDRFLQELMSDTGLIGQKPAGLNIASGNLWGQFLEVL